MSDTSCENAAVSEKVVLIVDDEQDVRRAIARALRREGVETVAAASAAEGLRVIEEAARPPQVVISDFKMPGVDGVTFLAEVRRRWPYVQRILLTGFADVGALERAINEVEVFRFIAKPWDNGVLITTVRSAFEEHSLREENRRLLRLSQEQNLALSTLNKGLEARVEERTRLLERAKKDWESTFDAIVDPVAIIDTRFRVRRSNRAYGGQAESDLPEVVGRNCYEALAGYDQVCNGCPVKTALQTGQASHGEITDARYGQIFQVFVFPILEAGEVEKFVCYYRNVTEEKELQQRLLQTEKMAAVGQLAGGVAHEINNPLAGILAFTQLLLRDASPGTDGHTFLKEIESSALRCKRIVENLLRFSRRSPIADRESVRLNEVVDNTIFLVEHQFQLKGVRIERDLASDLTTVRANSNQMAQVLLNLLTNAFGAMPRGGTIHVRTYNDGAQVCVSVSDNGVGIARKHITKIFEPFFTTKADGTGLGLAVSADIVQAHGGKIGIESEEGKGSTFTVALPVHREIGAEAKAS